MSVQRLSLRCPYCQKETYQRIAESGVEVLLIGKAQRFNPTDQTVRWNCSCGAEHRLSLADTMVKSAGENTTFAPKIVTIPPKTIVPILRRTGAPAHGNSDR